MMPVPPQKISLSPGFALNQNRLRTTRFLPAFTLLRLRNGS